MDNSTHDKDGAAAAVVVKRCLGKRTVGTCLFDLGLQNKETCLLIYLWIYAHLLIATCDYYMYFEKATANLNLRSTIGT